MADEFDHIRRLAAEMPPPPQRQAPGGANATPQGPPPGRVGLGASPREQADAAVARMKMNQANGQYAPTRENSSLFDKTIGSFGLGMAEDPLLEPILDAVGFDDERRDAMRARLQDSTVSDIFEFAGEWAPYLGGAWGAFSAGRAVATKGAKMAFPHVKKFLTQEVGEEAIESAPKALLASQALGGASFEGGLEGSREYARTGDIQKAVETGGTAFALTLAFEGVFQGATRAFANRHGIGRREANERIWREKARGKVQDQVNELRAHANQLAEDITMILPVKAQGRSLNQIAETNLRLKNIGEKYKRKKTKREQAIRVGLHKLDEFAPTPAELAVERRRLISDARKLGGELKETRNLLRNRQRHLDAPEHAIYLRDRSIGPEDKILSGKYSEGSFQKFVAKWIGSPETAFRKLGVTGAQFLDDAHRAEQAMEASLVYAKNEVHQAQSAMMRALTGKGAPGLIRRTFKPHVDEADKLEMLDVFSAWQKAGGAGVRNLLTDRGKSESAREVIKSLERLDKLQRTTASRLNKMGGKGSPTREELTSQGFEKYVPRQLTPQSRQRSLDAMRRSRATARLDDRHFGEMLEQGKSGMAHGGKGLYNVHALSGMTPREIYDEFGDTFLADPFQNVLLDVIGNSKKVNYGKFLGVRQQSAAHIAGEADRPLIGKGLGDDLSIEAQRERLMQAVEAEGGDAALFSSLFDSAVGSDYYDVAMKSVANTIVSTQIAAKLATAVIPNMTQGLNTALRFGLGQTFKNMIRPMRTMSDESLHAAGVLDWIGNGTLEAYRLADPTSAGIAGRAAHFVMEASQFSRVERWNKATAAGAGLGYFRQTVAKAANGNLRGATLAKHRRAFKELGVDLDTYVKQVMDGTLSTKAVKEIEEQIAFRSMQQTQFLNSPTRKPGWWNTPQGRVITQFKSFAFNQTKLIRDSVLAEAGGGNIVPLATMMAIHPVAGGVVNGAKDFVTGEAPQVGDVVDNMMAVGGFGIVSDFVRSAGMRRGMDTLAGPTASDAVRIASDIATLSPGSLADWAIGQPLVKTTVATGIKGIGLGILGWDALGKLDVFDGSTVRETLDSMGDEERDLLDRNAFYTNRRDQ